MSLLDDMRNDELAFMNKQVTEGALGQQTVYVEGAKFWTALAYQSSTAARVAEVSEQIGNWQITVSPEINLEKNDIVKVIQSDNEQIVGKWLKIDKGTADIKTPEQSSFQFRQAYAYEILQTTKERA